MILYIKSLAGDHPRLCGEKSASAFAVRMDSGSPRLCGEKQAAPKCVRIFPGITPAYAGKSLLLDVPRTRL